MKAVTVTSTAAPQQVATPQQAVTDLELVALWLHGRPATTQRAYAVEVRRFMAAVQAPFHAVTLAMLQRYADELAHLSPAAQARALAAVKSLFSFAVKLGYLQFNPAAVVKLPAIEDKLASRILPEADVQRILALTTGRDHALLRLLYASGARVAEVCRLTWSDLQPRGDAGQVRLFGKRGKTRVVLLTQATWQVLMDLRGAAPADAYVFTSRQGNGKPLTTVQVFRIVRAAAALAGVQGNVSPHWLRHCHASHALERGASIALVQSTLGHSSLAVTSRYVHARPDSSSATVLAV